MGLDMYFYARKTTYKSFSKWDKPDRADETKYPEDLKTFSDYIYDRNFKDINSISLIGEPIYKFMHRIEEMLPYED